MMNWAKQQYAQISDTDHENAELMSPFTGSPMWRAPESPSMALQLFNLSPNRPAQLLTPSSHATI